MQRRTEIHKLLEKNGAVLLRSNKHEVWKLPNGKNIVVSHNSKDMNVVRQIKRTLEKLK